MCVCVCPSVCLASYQRLSVSWDSVSFLFGLRKKNEEKAKRENGGSIDKEDTRAATISVSVPFCGRFFWRATDFGFFFTDRGVNWREKYQTNTLFFVSKNFEKKMEKSDPPL